jgi:hypothetical protein
MQFVKKMGHYCCNEPMGAVQEEVLFTILHDVFRLFQLQIMKKEPKIRTELAGSTQIHEKEQLELI